MIYHAISFLRALNTAPYFMITIAFPEQTTASDTIYRAIREGIVSGHYAPGERLVHRQLAKHFSSSSIPVLEALRRLEGEGLVVSQPNVGARVKVWTEEDIIATYMAREALEGVTCRLFAINASPKEKAKCNLYNEMFDEACRNGEVDEATRIDSEFHLYIAGNYNADARELALFRIMKNSCLLTLTLRSIAMVKTVDKSYAGPIGVHDELIAALNSGDGDIAEAAGRKHVRSSMEGLVREFAEKKLKIA
jgi:DNA-binding GntR family transcriptional regulator